MIAFSLEQAKIIGKELGIDFSRYNVDQFRQGLNVELEHCNVTGCDPILTGKIAQAHLSELPDYYTRLAKMERGSEFWAEKELADKKAMEEASRLYRPKEVTMPQEERKSFQERIFGKGAVPPLETLKRGMVVNNLMPMSPEEGPPLPRMLALRWPWKK